MVNILIGELPFSLVLLLSRGLDFGMKMGM